MKMCLLLLFIGQLFLSGCDTQDIDYAMGTVERDRIKLSSPASEQIVDIKVHEGLVVHQGDILLQLDTVRANALVSQRNAELAQVSAALSLLNAGTRVEQLNAAKAALDATRSDSKEALHQYQRIIKLYKNHAVGTADMDVAKAKRNSTKAKQNLAHAQWLELKNGARQQDLSQARARVDAAKSALLWQQKTAEDLTIKAPVDGIIDSLPWYKGDRVITGTELMSVLAIAKPYARVYLPASALMKVKVGDPIDVFADGINTPIKGRVRNIRSQPAYTPFYALNERDRARLMYLTDIDLLQAESLPTGLAVEVHIP
ncbi:HlyD family efflux transporter periplasmic adaptor subunit [Pseudoalteromonas fuliginea]|uniref:HlyD family efflux transporter periplasmic adaptor subunit n=1 Tax=Pseudoalteromonas fuliginea TaxID=1872678 RepID=A0AB73BBN0_9GAMM|nr:HlyD family efflux transporter periplasmic adaptor subunit [Pseudoalteromonas fuliginea]KAA1156489.1 HlyD family efflux transporter periplasmic adaptor subunit [Pseudoalteromonas fuliginea]